MSRSSRSQISPSQVECENDQNKRETTEYMNIQRKNTHEKLFSANDTIKNQVRATWKGLYLTKQNFIIIDYSKCQF